MPNSIDVTNSSGENITIENTPETIQAALDKGWSHIAAPSETTQLSQPEEYEFQDWAKARGINNPDDPNQHYDYRGAFKGGLEPDKNGHWSDQYKQHGHPTFSNESVYSKGPGDGGTWSANDKFVPSPGTENPIASQVSEHTGVPGQNAADVGGQIAGLPFTEPPKPELPSTNVDITPLLDQAKYPASAPGFQSAELDNAVANPNAKKLNLADSDFTKEGAVRVTNGKEVIEIESDPETINIARFKGWIPVSEHDAPAIQQQKNQEVINQYMQDPEFIERSSTAKTLSDALKHNIIGEAANPPHAVDETSVFAGGPISAISQAPNEYQEFLQKYNEGRKTPDWQIPLQVAALQALAGQHDTVHKIANATNLATDIAFAGAGSGGLAEAESTAIRLLGLHDRVGILGAAARTGTRALTGAAILSLPSIVDNAIVKKDPLKAATDTAVMFGLGLVFGSGGEAFEHTIEGKTPTAGITNALLDSLKIEKQTALEAAAKPGTEGQEELLQKLYKQVSPDELAKMSNTKKGDMFIRFGKEGEEELASLARRVDTEGPNIAANPNGYRVRMDTVKDAIQQLKSDITGTAQENILNSALKTIDQKLKKSGFEVGIPSTLNMEETNDLLKVFGRNTSKNADEQNLHRQIEDYIKQERNEQLVEYAKAANDPKLISTINNAAEKSMLSNAFNGPALKASNNFGQYFTFTQQHGGIGTLGHLVVAGGLTQAIDASQDEGEKLTKLQKAEIAAASFATTFLGGRYGRYYLESGGRGKFANWLLKQNAVEGPGLLIAEGNRLATDKLKAIPTIADKWSAAAQIATGHTLKTEGGDNFVRKLLGTEKTPDPIVNLLGGPEAANGLSKDQQLSKAISMVMAMNDGAGWEDHKARVLEAFKDYPDMLPYIAQRMESMRAVIQKYTPKSAQTGAFQKPGKPVYSSEDIIDFKDAIRFASDPYDLLHELHNGTLTPKKVAMVAEMFPEVLETIKQELLSNSHKDQVYQQRLRTSILLQQKIDVSQNNVSGLQQSALIPIQSQPGAKPPRAHKGSKEGSSSYATPNQKNVGDLR